MQQALQPYPQYRSVNAYTAGGEKSGDSSYHAMMLKLDKRYSSGLTLLASYVLSKMFANTDAANESQRVHQTHLARVVFSYELPVGKGNAIAPGGAMGKILGDWATSGFLEYASGTPYGVGPGVTPPIYPGGGGNRAFITSYDNWRAPIQGEKFGQQFT